MKSVIPPKANKDSDVQDIMHNQNKPEVDLHQLFEDSPIAFYTCDRNGYLTFYNRAAAVLWGRDPELGKDLWCGSWKIYYPNGGAMPLEDCPMAKVLKEGVEYDSERINIERPDGTYRNLLVFPRPIFDDNRRLQGAHNTLVDITEQQSAEIRKATLSAIVESSDDAIVSKDLNGFITSWNYGAERIFKYKEEEVIGKHISLLIPKPRLEEEKHILKNIRAGNKVDHFETIRIDKNGKEISISLTVSPVKDSAGNIVGASKIARDISARVQAEAEIRKYTENLEILNSIGKSISENMDVKANIQKVTDATTALTGAAFGAFFYNTVDEEGDAYMLFALSGAPRKAFEKFGMPRNTRVFHPTFSGEEVVRVDDITKDPRYGHNHPHYGMPKGHLPVVSYMAVPVVSTSGEVIGGLFFGHPESGVFKKEHEDMVVNIAAQAATSLDNSKLFEQVKSLSAKKDEFIALASHELKTPLTTIKGYLQILAQEEGDGTSSAFLKKSLRQVNRLNALVEDLLNMSRIEAGRLELDLDIFDLRQLLSNTIETFSYSHNSHELLYDLGERSAVVNGDKQRIEQVILNLMTNAVKYSPEGNEVYVKLEVDSENATVSVKDEGIGLTEEQTRQIFTRFYRADNTYGSSGLGLGLYLAKQIIDRHNGTMKVKSTLGEGSEFLFSIPLTKGKPV